MTAIALAIAAALQLLPILGGTDTGESTDEAHAARRARVLVAQAGRIEMVRRLSPSVVCIFPKDDRAGGGSGVIIDSDGYGLTNFHVVAPLLPSRAGEGGLADGKLYDLEVLGLDPVGDVAMFRLSGKMPFTPAEFGDAEALAVGDETLALGNPFLLAEDYTPTVTFGIISGLHRYQPGAGRALIYSDCIQVDASINPGNSGGPLFNIDGKLIGINGRVSIEERGRINVGVGYAITINQVRRFIPALRAGLTTQHGASGFTVTDAPDGVVVDRIVEDSRAARAGVRVGDSVLQFAGATIRSANHFLSLLGTFPADWPVDMVLAQGEASRKLRLRLDASPLPRPRGPQRPPSAKAPDPFAPIEAAAEPNKRAVRRALKLFAESSGGHSVLARIARLEWSGRRFNVEPAGSSPTPIEVDEDRPNSNAISDEAAPDVIERAIRWALYAADPKAANPPYRVVGADEVAGHVAVMLESRKDAGRTHRIGLDDETGELLLIEFQHGPQNELVRFEYGDVQRSGAIRHPTRRRIYRNDRLVAEEQYDSVVAVGP